MLASDAITSTPGVMMSFSCIVGLLHPMPWPRVAASRPETPRPPHGAAAGVTHAQHLTGACPCLSASFIPPGGWAARDPVRCRDGLGMRLRRYPSRRVADRLRMREACDSE